jgi:hypothetical protein
LVRQRENIQTAAMPCLNGCTRLNLHLIGLSFILEMSCMRLISMEASLAAMTIANGD